MILPMEVSTSHVSGYTSTTIITQNTTSYILSNTTSFATTMLQFKLLPHFRLRNWPSFCLCNWGKLSINRQFPQSCVDSNKKITPVVVCYTTTRHLTQFRQFNDSTFFFTSTFCRYFTIFTCGNCIFVPLVKRLLARSVELPYTRNTFLHLHIQSRTS